MPTSFTRALRTATSSRSYGDEGMASSCRASSSVGVKMGLVEGVGVELGGGEALFTVGVLADEDEADAAAGAVSEVDDEREAAAAGCCWGVGVGARLGLGDRAEEEGYLEKSRSAVNSSFSGILGTTARL